MSTRWNRVKWSMRTTSATAVRARLCVCELVTLVLFRSSCVRVHGLTRSHILMHHPLTGHCHGLLFCLQMNLTLAHICIVSFFFTEEYTHIAAAVWRSVQHIVFGASFCRQFIKGFFLSHESNRSCCFLNGNWAVLPKKLLHSYQCFKLAAGVVVILLF